MKSKIHPLLIFVSRFIGSIAILLSAAGHAATIDTTAKTTTYTAPKDILNTQFIGNGTLNFKGSGLISLDNSGSGNPVTMAMTGGSITVQTGVTFRNGGLQGGIWSNNRASLSVASGATLDLWGVNPLRANALTGAGKVTISNTAGINWAGARSLVLGVNGGGGTFTGIISGNSSSDGGSINLTKEGAGTQILSGANTYGGGTYINSGALRIRSNTALGQGGFSASTWTQLQSGASLEIDGSLTIDEHIYLAGSGVGGTGALRVLSGNSTLTTACLLVNNAKIDVAAGASLTQNNAFYDTGGLTKSGVGTLVLSGNNTYAGATNINSGTLRIRSNTALGQGGFSTATWTQLQSGASLEIDGSLTIDEHIYLAGSGVGGTGALRVLSGNSTFSTACFLVDNVKIDVAAGASLTQNNAFYDAGGLTKSGSGTLTLSGNNAYTGATAINGGTIQYNNTAAVGSTSKITVNNGGSIYFPFNAGTINMPIELNGVGSSGGALQAYAEGGQLTFTGPLTLLGSSKIYGYASNSTLNFTNAIGGTGNLTFFGQGAAVGHRNFMVLSGSNNFVGDLYIDNYATAAQVTLSGGDNRLPTTAVIHIGAGAWNSGNSSALNLNGSNQTLAGLSDVGVSALTGARTIVNTSSTTVILTLNTQSSQAFSGTIGGSDISGNVGNNLALLKTGNGTQTLTGTNTYTGDTTVTGGTLAVTGSSIKDTNKLIISGGKVDLTGTETVNTLFFGGVPQVAGIYSATGAGGTIASGNFTGSGTLIVTSFSVGDFEYPSLAGNSFSYGTAGTGWSLAGGAGVSSNGSAITSANPNAPGGNQVLFLQGSSSASSTVNIPAGQAGTYRIQLKAAQRFGNNQTVRITLNGIQIDSITPPNKFYVDYRTRDVYLPAGNRTFLLEGTNPFGGDNTILIDDLSIVKVSDPQYWSNPATWDGTVPAAGDHVDIPAGKIVVLDQDIIADSIIVRGTLRFDPTKDLTVTACSLIAEGKALVAADPKPEGRIEIGTEQTPFTKRVVLTLTGGVCTAPTACTCAATGHEMTDGNVMSAINGGVLDIHGSTSVGVGWNKLNATIQPGATSITLASPVNWPIGAQILITSSTTDPFQAETCTIASVTNGGLTVNLTAGVTNMHAGVQQSYTRTGGGRTWNLDLRAEVGLLTRNITVQGDAASVTSGFGGHVMIMKSGSTLAGATDFIPGGRGYVENAEFYRMGRKSVKGKYPLHFHMLGEEGKGQYFKNNSVHDSYNRAIVIHGTESTLVESNFCYDHIGHGLMLEDGSERFNRITKNVVVLTRRPPISEAVTPSDNNGNPRLQTSLPASYWITNPNNIVDDNVAAGTEGTGMWLLFPREVVGLSKSDTRFMNQNPSLESLGSMQRNVTHSSYCGLQTNGGLTQDHALIGNLGTGYAGGMIVRDATLYANRLGTYGGLTDYTDPSLITHRGFVIADSEFGIMQANNSLTEDSLAVADSGLGLIPSSLTRAFQLSYDGPARVKDCHLVGYDAVNTSLLGNSGASFKRVNAPFSGMTYSPAGPPRINLPDYTASYVNPRIWGMVFRDLDGTTTQQANTSIIMGHPFLKTPGDYQSPNWTNIYRSNRKFAYTTVNAASFLPNEAFVDMTVTREKVGESSTSVFYSHSFDVQVELPLIANEDYYYTYQFHTMPTNYFRYGIGNVAVGDFVRLRFRDFGKASNLAITSNASVTKVYSKAAVDNSGTSAYFADTSTGDLWVKWLNYSTGAHEMTYCDVTWSGTFTPTPEDTDRDGMSDYKESLAGRDPFSSRDLAFNFDTDSDFEGWILNGMQAYIVSGGNQVSRTAGSGNLTHAGLAINGSLVSSLAVRYQSEAAGTLRLYWATSENNSFSESRALNATSSYSPGSGFVTTRFDFTGHPEWAGKTITALRLDTFGTAGFHTWIDYIRNGSINDADGDGIADFAEISTGRNPDNASDFAFNFDTDGDFEGWILNGMTSYIVGSGSQLSRTAGSGNLTRSGLAMDGSQISSLVVNYQSEAAGTLRLYWATSENNLFSETRALNATSSYSSGSGFVTTHFDFAGHPEWTGKTITALRLDTFGVAGLHTWIDYIRASGSSSQSLLGLSSAPFIYLPTDADTLLKPSLSSGIQSNGMRRSGVSIDAQAGTTYRLMASPDLSAGSWHEVNQTTATLTERIELKHDSDAPKQFYRIEYDLPVIIRDQ